VQGNFGLNLQNSLNCLTYMLDYIVMQIILLLNAKDKSRDSTVHVINTIGYISYLAFLTDFWTAWILQVICEEVTSLCISITRLFSTV